MLSYFDGITFGASDRVLHCPAWLDQTFDCYALNYAHSGRLRWRGRGGKTTWLQAPVLFWTWPGPRFTYGAEPGTGATWDQSYVTYRGPRAAMIMKQGLAPRAVHPWAPVSDIEQARTAFDSLLDCLHRPVPAVAEAVHLLEGLYLLAHSRPPVATDPLAAAIERIADEIRLAPHRAWEADIEADRMGFSAVHLRRLFSHRFKTPFHRFVVLARMQAAARLLRRTDLKVKVVAERCGYPDFYHFTKAFHTLHGRPPAAYREQARRLRSPRAASVDLDQAGLP